MQIGRNYKFAPYAQAFFDSCVICFSFSFMYKHVSYSSSIDEKDLSPHLVDHSLVTYFWLGPCALQEFKYFLSF